MRELNLAVTLRANEASILYNAACLYCKLNRKPDAHWMRCIKPGKRGSGTPCGLGAIRTSSLFMTTRSLIACTRRSLRHRTPPVPTSSTCFEVHTHSTFGPREGIKDKVLSSVPNSSPEQVHYVNTFRLFPSSRPGLSRWRGGRYRVGEPRDFRQS